MLNKPQAVSTLDALSSKIRDGIVIPAKSEASSIIEKAKEQSVAILEIAKIEAKKIIDSSKAEADKLENMTKSSIKQAFTSASIEIKKSITDNLFNNLIIADVEKLMDNKDFSEKFISILESEIKIHAKGGVATISMKNSEDAKALAEKYAKAIGIEFHHKVSDKFELSIRKGTAKIDIDSSWIAGIIMKNIKQDLWSSIFNQSSIDDIIAQLF